MKRLLMLALALLLFGCLEPSVRLGCCMKVNASGTDPTCVLYNTTSLTTTNAYAGHCGSTDCTNSCNATKGECNLTIGTGNKKRDYMVPICTQDMLVGCVSPNCTAMICGDFKFKPHIAPGIVGDDISDVKPTDADTEGGTQEFYKAQCRFFPMDTKLSKIMKNSKSKLNVFRMGIGGSFDEYDQYRYFFPISDKYCSVNQPITAGQKRVDRYMNYLGSDMEPYDYPLQNITENCLDDVGNPPPFGFNGSDRSDYKRAEEVRQVYAVAVGQTSWTKQVTTNESGVEFTPPSLDLPPGYTVTWEGNDTVGWNATFKYTEGSVGAEIQNAPWAKYVKIDTDGYRRALAIAHAATLYGNASTCGVGFAPSGGERAPFECDASANDCYSSTCNTQKYIRSGMVESSNNPSTAREIMTDCNEVGDENDQIKVLCAPTMSVTIPCDKSSAPIFGYAKAIVKRSRTVTLDSAKLTVYNNVVTGAAAGDEDFDSWWNGTHYNRTIYGIVYPITAKPEDAVTNYANSSFYVTTQNSCPEEYGETNSTEQGICSTLAESEAGPPIAGAVFFGKTGDTNVVSSDNKTIIGYSVARPGDFEQMLVVKNCNMKNGTDYELVELNTIGDSAWIDLTSRFTPYLHTRFAALKLKIGDSCSTTAPWGNTDYLQSYDVVISSMPWVVGYTKWIGRSCTDKLYPTPLGFPVKSDICAGWQGGYTKLGEHVVSESAQALRKKNTYDEEMATALGTSSCALRSTTSSEQGKTFLNSFKSITFTYDIVFSKYIYLFKYNEGSKKIGTCAVDENTLLPKTKTYGWCEPCTTSTLAYQNVTARATPYIPKSTKRTRDNRTESICSQVGYWVDMNEYTKVGDVLNKIDRFGIHFPDYQYFTNTSCFHTRISDIQDYNGLTGDAPPRTVPEASIMKERLGDYMKSGVLPVLDLSDPSNWNNSAAVGNYTKYDFENLFGEMGAAIVILAHVGNMSDVAPKTQDIADRSGAIRDYCYGCLTAVHVDTPANSTAMEKIVNTIFLDPRAKFNIDMVTFDYPVSSHPNMTTADMVVDDITSYGRASLQQANKPTMVVGFNVRSDDPVWSGNYPTLFSAIAMSQPKLVKAGVTGVIYSPVRDNSTPIEGIVDTTSGTGVKGLKFCAMEDAMRKMSMKAPVALFSRITPYDQINCTRCTSLDKLQDACGPPPGGDAPVCDNGVKCNLGNLDKDDAKCPENIIAGNCTLCSSIPGTYSCTINYTNGTSTVMEGPMAAIDSDLYADVLGGIPKPYKCCVGAVGGGEYSYSKKAYPTETNQPLAFPKSGLNETDCGFGVSPNDVSALTSFCGAASLLFKQYDVVCNITSAPATGTLTIQFVNPTDGVYDESGNPISGNTVRPNSTIRANVRVVNSSSPVAGIRITLYDATSGDKESERTKAGTTEFGAEFTALPQGTYYIKASVADTAGRLNYTASRNITVIDHYVFSVNFTQPTPTTTVSTEYIALNATAYGDPDLGPPSYQNLTIYLYNSTRGLVDSATTTDNGAITVGFFHNFTGLAKGQYYFNATAFDAAGGSESTATKSVQVS